MAIKYAVYWDNGNGACGTFEQRFDTEEARSMDAKDQTKLDEAIAGRVYDALPHGGFEVGDTIEVDVRFGDEGGPDNWTRCEATVEQRHIDLAKRWVKQ
jgi:peptide subunit release factor RF-3